MNLRFVYLTIVWFAMILMETACAAKATPSAADQMATNIAHGVSIALTKTAEAPTPLPSAIATRTPIPATLTPTNQPIQNPVVSKLAGCWFGPGPTYNMESSITQGQSVQLLGVGSVPGWYIILNPYFFQPCWIPASSLSIDPHMDLSQLPMVTPIPLRPTPKP
jgi:hypothetical protein